MKCRTRDHPREDQCLPIVRRAVVAQLRRPGALLAQHGQGELCHVADHQTGRLARLANGKVDPLAAARVAAVLSEDDGRAKDGLVEDLRRRAGEQDVQVVHRGLVKPRPPHVRRITRGEGCLHRWQHQEVCTRAAKVGVLARPRKVQLARNARKAKCFRLGLALCGAIGAHAAHAAFARGQNVAALAGRGGERVGGKRLGHGCRRRRKKGVCFRLPHQSQGCTSNLLTPEQHAHLQLRLVAIVVPRLHRLRQTDLAALGLDLKTGQLNLHVLDNEHVPVKARKPVRLRLARKLHRLRQDRIRFILRTLHFVRNMNQPGRILRHWARRATVTGGAATSCKLQTRLLLALPKLLVLWQANNCVDAA